MNRFIVTSVLSLAAASAQAARYQIRIYETPAEFAKRTVTINGDQVRIAQRPAASSSKAELGGYSVIQADKLKDAVAWAAQAPSPATDGAVEVCPFYQVPGMMASSR